MSHKEVDNFGKAGMIASRFDEKKAPRELGALYLSEMSLTEKRHLNKYVVQILKKRVLISSERGS